MRHRFATLALVAMTLFVAPRAKAQSTKIAAEALFEEGRRLMAEEKFADACPKFADSHGLDPSSGTLLNLANCYEKMGKLATAWATYREAASLAAASGRTELVTVGQKHAESLAPRLSRLSIVVPNAVDDMRIQRDGVLVTAAERGVPIPVDAGLHRIEVTAPNKKPWVGTVNVAEVAESVSLTVPALEDAPPPPRPAAGPPPVAALDAAPSTQGWGAQRTIGAVVVGAGVVGLGLSAGFAIAATSKYNESLAFCPQSKNVCEDQGVQRRDDARAAGNVATVAFTLGAIAVATGATLFILAPTRTKRTALEVQAAPTAGGAMVHGRW
jgi:tetratricopeptide (TPR) repeat protein